MAPSWQWPSRARSSRWRPAGRGFAEHRPARGLRRNSAIDALSVLRQIGRLRLRLWSSAWGFLRRPLFERPRAQRSPWSVGGDEARAVRGALDRSICLKRPREVLVSLRGNNVTRQCMARMRRGEWLNDELINVYLGMLDKYAKQRPRMAHRAHVMSCFFYTRLARATDTAAYDYDGVRRWTKDVDLRRYQRILVPINLGQAHWVLAAIDLKAKRFELLDSYRPRHPSCARLLRPWLAEEWHTKYGAHVDVSHWPSVLRDDAPVQGNGFDCGVFVCMYVRCLVFGRKLDFSQADIPSIRQWMAYEMLTKTIIPRSFELGPGPSAV